MAQDYLPDSMRNILQLATDGCSVMHRLHADIRDRFIRGLATVFGSCLIALHLCTDLIPGIDDIHQLERSLVHAMRGVPYIMSMLKAVAAVIKCFRKSDIQQVQRIHQLSRSKSLFADGLGD